MEVSLIEERMAGSCYQKKSISANKKSDPKNSNSAKKSTFGSVGTASNIMPSKSNINHLKNS
jgi:hypothetical protein